jgi:hypothetical protein
MPDEKKKDVPEVRPKMKPKQPERDQPKIAPDKVKSGLDWENIIGEFEAYYNPGIGVQKAGRYVAMLVVKALLKK